MKHCKSDRRKESCTREALSWCLLSLPLSKMISSFSYAVSNIIMYDGFWGGSKITAKLGTGDLSYILRNIFFTLIMSSPRNLGKISPLPTQKELLPISQACWTMYKKWTLVHLQEKKTLINLPRQNSPSQVSCQSHSPTTESLSTIEPSPLFRWIEHWLSSMLEV